MESLVNNSVNNVQNFLTSGYCPEEVVDQIFSYLPLQDRYHAGLVNNYCLKIFNKDDFWKCQFALDFPHSVLKQENAQYKDLYQKEMIELAIQKNMKRSNFLRRSIDFDNYSTGVFHASKDVCYFVTEYVNQLMNSHKEIYYIECFDPVECKPIDLLATHPFLKEIDAVSDDERYVYVLTDDRRFIEIFDKKENTLKKGFFLDERAHVRTGYTMQSHNGILYVRLASGKICAYDIEAGGQIDFDLGHIKEFRICQEHLVASDGNGVFKIYNLLTKELTTVKNENAQVECFAADDRAICTTSNQIITKWKIDLETASLEQVGQLDFGEEINRIYIDGNYLIVGGTDTISAYDFNAFSYIANLSNGYTGEKFCVQAGHLIYAKFGCVLYNLYLPKTGIWQKIEDATENTWDRIKKIWS